jgi:hypothetical protein
MLRHLFIPHLNKGNSAGMNGAKVKLVRTRHIQTQVNNMMQNGIWSISIGINIGKAGMENTFVNTITIWQKWQSLQKNIYPGEKNSSIFPFSQDSNLIPRRRVPARQPAAVCRRLRPAVAAAAAGCDGQ